MQVNPITVRELRARWRNWAAFALLFGYATLLAIAMGWRYGDALTHTYLNIYTNSTGDDFARMSFLGHELFHTMTWMQALAWLLIAPAITATAIAGERERGLLEGLQLAPLTPWRIVGGKLLSALSFVVLMILVSLPITAICFLMGGVSPGEFYAALLLHLVTAMTGLALGLACSAWSHRAGNAVRVTFVWLFAWAACTALAFIFAQASAFMMGGAPTPSLWIQFWGYMALFFALTNPIVAALSITTPESRQILSFLSFVPLPDVPVWIVSIVFQSGLSLLLLKLATWGVYRPLREEYWVQRKSRKRKIQSQPSAVADEHAKPQEREAEPGLWWELPWLSRWPAANPVLRREVRSKFRMRQAPLWALFIQAALGVVILYYYLRTLWWAIFEPHYHEGIWWALSFIGLLLVMFATAIMGAGAFTREREQGTWEALNLSLVTPGEIIRGKLGASLLACLVYSIPLWPLMIPCIRYVEYSGPNYGPRFSITLVQAVATLLIVSATAWCYTLWGMFWSWKCRHTTAAIGWTIGTLFFALVFVPFFFQSAFSSSPGNNPLSFFHPLIALGYVADSGRAIIPPSILCSFLLLIAGCVLLVWLYLDLSTHIREKDPYRSTWSD